MLQRMMDEHTDIAPVPGLLASLTLATANTASWSPKARDETPAYHRLITNAPNTSNTTPSMRVFRLSHTDVGSVVLSLVRNEERQGFYSREAIFELRRLTGLTWEDLAELMSVSRRTLHLWSNGQPINTPNEKRLRDLVSAMRSLDRGTARENRALLVSPRPDGGIFSDLLREERFAEALALTGRGNGRPILRADVSAGSTRTGYLSIEDSFNTRSDRIHIDEGLAVPRRQRRPRQT